MTPTTARRWRLPAVAAILALPVAWLGPATDAGSAGAPPSAASDAVRLRPAPINLTAPTRVEAGSRIRFSGSLVVKQRKPRKVVLAERVGARWRTVARTRSTKGGTFAIVVPAGKQAGTRTFRASAPAASGLSALVTNALRVKVQAKPTTSTPPPTPTTPPPGSVNEADDWSYLVDGGIRWNPCSTIRWAYNPSGQRYDALADVTTAFANIAAASGLTFQYVGTTSYRYLDDGAKAPAGVDIAVAWADESELEDLSGDVVGVGGGFFYPVSGYDVRWRMARGYLTLDKGGAVTPAPGYNGQGWGQIMMHEILHALGLGHAKLSNQLMYPVASPRNYGFGLGDRTGMTRIGSAPGCLG